MTQRAPQTPRFRRVKPDEPFILNSRDLRILEALCQFRYLRSHQIARLVAFQEGEEASEAKIKRRLNPLFKSGYIDRPSAQRRFFSEDEDDKAVVYALATSGARFLEEQKSIKLPPGISWKNKKVSQPHLLHATETAEILLSIQILLKDRFITQDEILGEAYSKMPSLKVVFTFGEDKIRHEERIIPDGLFGVRREDGKRSLYFVEADRGTMPVTRHGPKQTSLLMKVRSYFGAARANLWESNFNEKSIQTIFVVPNQKRRDNFLVAVLDLTEGKGSRQFIYACQEQFPVKDTAVKFLTGKGEEVSILK